MPPERSGWSLPPRSLSFKCFYLFLTVLCLGCCVGFSLAVVSGGYSLVVGPLIVAAPPAAEHGIRAHKLHELQHVGSVVVAPGP